MFAHPLDYYRAPAPATLDPYLVAVTAQIAHQMGILTQQGPRPSPAYRDQLGRPDAIGVSLPDDYAHYHNTLPVPALPLNPEPTTEELTSLSMLQLRSDQWARDPSNPLKERAFLEQLQQMRTQWAPKPQPQPTSSSAPKA